MKEYKQIKGDVTEPIGEGNKIICHCVNSIFVMGAGVALAIKKKWPIVYSKYKAWRHSNPQLGDVQFVKVASKIVVANIMGQEGIGFKDGIAPIRYEAMDRGFKKVTEIAKKYDASVHLPLYVCCGLAGGKWDKIEELIINDLCSNEIEVFIYDFNNTRPSVEIL